MAWRAMFSSVIPGAVPYGDVIVPFVMAGHVAAALPHLADDYMGEHWLASFALLALLPQS